MLERADKTSRILDVKYFILLPSASDVGTFGVQPSRLVTPSRVVCVSAGASAKVGIAMRDIESLLYEANAPSSRRRQHLRRLLQADVSD